MSTMNKEHQEQVEYLHHDLLPKQTFFWIMGIFVAIVISITGWTVTTVLAVQETFNHSFTEVKVDIAEIQVDLRLLRQTLQSP